MVHGKDKIVYFLVDLNTKAKSRFKRYKKIIRKADASVLIEVNLIVLYSNLNMIRTRHAT
jgi:hypothetical protein